MRVIVMHLFTLLFIMGMPASSPAQIDAGDSDQDMRAMIGALNEDIGELEFLSAALANSRGLELELLEFRRDERGFQILVDIDLLIAELTSLPDRSPEKEDVRAQLAVLCEGIGDTIFGRLEDIEQRIIDSRTEIESLSGGAVVAAEAHIQSLESIRIRYYESLVTHIQNREFLGLSSVNLLNRLKPDLHLFAETLAGQIELSGAAQTEVQGRAGRDPDNADIAAALIEFEHLHRVNLKRLEAIIVVLESLGIDSSKYQAVMLQHSSNISVNFFSLKAIVAVFKDSWAAFKNAWKENAPDLLFKIFLFFAVLFVFKLLSRFVKRVVRAATERSSMDMSELLKDILVSTTGGAVMVLGVFMALAQVGISLGPMLAGLGMAGFIIGFALQDTLGNFAAGAMILIYRPFDVDDFVEVTDASGLVKKMNLVSTTIATFDNQTLVVPNSKIWGDVIKNITAQKERRVDLEFGIGYDDDVEHAERVLTDIVTAHEKVLEDPEPTIKLHTLGDSSVNFVVRPWTKTGDYWEVYWDIMREVKLRFDREGISIPFPQRDVHLFTEEPEQDGEEAQ